MGLYKKLWAQSQGEPDAFFQLLGTAVGIRTEVLEPGKSWQILYPACGCDLVTGGYVRTPAICEYSRLGIACCLGRVWPGHRFTVTKEKTILQGDACCCFLVALA